MYFVSKSAAIQNFIPNLSGLDAMYCRKGQRTFVGNNCSSTVMCCPGLYDNTQFWTKRCQMSEIAANLSVCERSRRVSLLSKRKYPINSWYRSRDIVDIIAGLPKFFDQQSRIAPFPPAAPLKNNTAMNAISSSTLVLQSGFVLRARWTVHALMVNSMLMSNRQRKLCKRLVTLHLANSVGPELVNDVGVVWTLLKSSICCWTQTVPSFAVSSAGPA